MRIPFYFWLGMLLLALGCTTTHQTKPSYSTVSISQPEFFPIMPWDFGRPPSTNGLPRAGLETMADCNFTVGGFAYPKDLRAFEKLGLGAFVNCSPSGKPWSQLSDAEIDQFVKTNVQAAGSSPAVVAFSLQDEPNVREFPALGKAVAAVKKYAPDKLAYINLFPDYATIGNPDKSQLGTESYTEYLERYVKEVQPQLISYDNYMVQYSQDGANPGAIASYYNNLIAVRSVAVEHHLPFINIIGCNIISPDSTPPSPASLMFQAYTTLAAGSRGMVWFTYYKKTGNFDYSPIDEHDRKTPVWAWLKEVNRQVVTLEPTMSRLTSTGVYFSSPAPTDKLPLLPGKWVESVTCATPVMIGEFQNRYGASYAMVVNLSLVKSARFKLKLAQPSAKVSLISAMDGAPIAFNTNEAYWLTAGQGVLLKLAK